MNSDNDLGGVSLKYTFLILLSIYLVFYFVYKTNSDYRSLVLFLAGIGALLLAFLIPVVNFLRAKEKNWNRVSALTVIIITIIVSLYFSFKDTFSGSNLFVGIEQGVLKKPNGLATGDFRIYEDEEFSLNMPKGFLEGEWKPTNRNSQRKEWLSFDRDQGIAVEWSTDTAGSFLNQLEEIDFLDAKNWPNDYVLVNPIIFGATKTQLTFYKTTRDYYNVALFAHVSSGKIYMISGNVDHRTEVEIDNLKKAILSFKFSHKDYPKNDDSFEESTVDPPQIDEKYLNNVNIKNYKSYVPSAQSAARAIYYLSEPNPFYNAIKGYDIDREQFPRDILGDDNPNPNGKLFSRTEFLKHNSAENCWIVNNNRVYELTNLMPYLDIHPAVKILKGLCGTDVTTIMDTSVSEPGSLNTARVRYALSTLYIGNIEE